MRALVFIIGFILALTSTLYFCKEDKNSASFYQVLSLQKYEGEMYNPQDYYESEDSLYKTVGTEKCVITKKETACNIAIALYKSKFGQKNQIKKVVISVLDGKIWKTSVVGKDSLVVYIQKSNGRILSLKKYENYK